MDPEATEQEQQSPEIQDSPSEVEEVPTAEESLQDLVKDTIVLSKDPEKNPSSQEAPLDNPPEPKKPAEEVAPLDTTPTKQPQAAEAESPSSSTHKDKNPHTNLVKHPSKLIRYQKQLIDEREFHEPIITPIDFVPVKTQNKRAKPVEPIVLVQALYRGRMARRKFRKLLKSSYIAREIYTTEKAYVEGLCFVIENYRNKLSEKNIIPKKDLDTLFFGLEDILVCNQIFLLKIRKRTEKWNRTSQLGDLFIELSKDLSNYTKFVNNYDRALDTLRRLKQNSSFVNFSQETELQRKGSRLTLSDTLIMPIQRVPRYVLLLGSFVETVNKKSEDVQKLEKAIEEIKSVAKYIDEKKGEAMSKIKVGEIQGQVNGDCPNLQTETRTFVKDADVVILTNGVRALKHVFFFNDAILCTTQTNTPQKKQSYDYDWLVNIKSLNLVSPIPVEDFNLIRGTNYIEPNLVMQEIQKLNVDLEIERNIERSANKMAQLYKQEQSTNFKKGHLKEATSTAESKMETLNKKLKVNQDLMRIFEPRFGLLITSTEKKGFTMVLRSEAQREEWIKEINGLRTKLGQAVDRQAEVNAMEKQKAKKDTGFFSGITSAVNSTVLMSAQALHFLARGFTGDYGDSKAKALPSSTPLQRKNSKIGGSVTSIGSTSSSSSANAPSGSGSTLERRRTMKESPSINDILKYGDYTSPFDTHNFVTKSFKRPTHCDFCGDLIWGLGREGVKCPDCSYRAHRKCAKQITMVCSRIPDVIIDQLDEEFEEDPSQQTAEGDEKLEGGDEKPEGGDQN